MPTHLDLDISFRRSGDDYQAQIVKSPVGDGQSVLFRKPFTDLELENLVLKIGRFRGLTRRVEAPPVVAAKRAGGRLFSLVFAGGVGECLRRSLDRAQAEHRTLRIRLRLSDCPELSDLPWELLYDQSEDWFLALSGTTPVVRYVQLPTQPRTVQITSPLRILVIRSEPVNYPALHLSQEWAQVAESLAGLTSSGLIAFTELVSPTLSELRRVLLSDTFHVLHYMGHGGFDERTGGVLLFTDRSGHSVPVTGGDLGVLLRDHTSMSLAVLNACEAGRTDPSDPFAGVADTLVRRGIPAVIAMQFEVSDQAAVEFAPALYGALATGRAVDVAVAEARKAVYTVSPLEWATPVLYLRADDARLFDVAAPAQSGPELVSTSAGSGPGGADLRPLDFVGVRVEQPTNQPIILLKERANRTYLPLWCGPAEAVSVIHAQQGAGGSYSLKDDDYDLPYALLCDTLQSFGIHVLSVSIIAFRDGVFYADLALSNGTKVSARPSDGIGLALWSGAQLFVTSAVLAECGVALDSEQADEQASPAMPGGLLHQMGNRGWADVQFPALFTMRQMDVTGVRIETETNKPLVLLREREGDRYLPVWISAIEATSIAFAKENTITERPLSHDLFADVLEALGIRLHLVRIVSARDGAYPCDLSFSGSKSVRARPGDAIALALRTGAGILASTEVLDQAGVMLPDEQTGTQQS